MALDCFINNRFACLTADGGFGECAAGTCLDLQNDSQNCGSYGFVCPPSSQCEGGQCVGSDRFAVCDPPHVETAIAGPLGSSSECLLETCTLSTDNQSCGTSDNAIGFCCQANCIAGDSDDCGGCGIVCQQGSVCAGPLVGCVPALDCASAPTNGICRLPDGSKGSCCNGACVDLSSDPKNCGICGMASPGGLKCVAGGPTGSCKRDADCPSGTICAYGEACLQTACPAGSAGVECALGDGVDATHGTCCAGSCVLDLFCGPKCWICQAGTVCLGSLCVPLGGCASDSGSEPSACATDAGTPGTCCGSICVDLNTDPNNCRSCGEACAPGGTCDGGLCSSFCNNVSCPTGSDCISGECVSESCSISGTACASGGLLGACCGDQCVIPDPGTGVLNTCGAVCPAGFIGPPQCLEPDSGAPSCGRAGNGACPQGDVCENNLCFPMLDCSADVASSGEGCAVGLNENGRCCGGACVDTRTDPLNCGLCGIVCASGICGGFAGSICLPAGPTDDCQQTCGPEALCLNRACIGSSCGTIGASGVVPNGGSYCRAQDGTVGECCGDGSCAHLRDDSLNCGSCGNVCAPGHACVGGMCEGSGCPANRMFDFCNLDGGPSWVCCLSTGCVDLLWDPSNCGGCDNSCPSGTACDAGECF